MFNNDRFIHVAFSTAVLLLCGVRTAPTQEADPSRSQRMQEVRQRLQEAFAKDPEA